MRNASPASAPYLKTNRSWLKTVLLGIITLGIYPLVLFTEMSYDINLIASRCDGKKTMHFCLLLFVIAPITLGIGAVVWYNRISDRIGNELLRRGIPYRFSAGSYWGWNVFGTLLLGIGPLIYLHKLCRATNLLCADYNTRG